MGKMIFLVEAKTKQQAIDILTVKSSYYYAKFLSIGHKIKELEYADTMDNYNVNRMSIIDDCRELTLSCFNQAFQSACFSFKKFRDNPLDLTKYEAGDMALTRIFHIVAAGMYKGIPTMCAHIIPFYKEHSKKEVEFYQTNTFSIFEFHKQLLKFKDMRKTWLIVYEIEQE